VGEALKRQVAKAAVLGLADVALDVGVAAMVEIELADAALAVGEEGRQAVAVVVGEGLLIALFELGAPVRSAAIALARWRGRRGR